MTVSTPEERAASRQEKWRAEHPDETWGVIHPETKPGEESTKGPEIYQGPTGNFYVPPAPKTESPKVETPKVETPKGKSSNEPVSKPNSTPSEF